MVTEQIPQAPAGWIGTLPEYLVFRELTRLQVEFEYQSSQMGGRQERGGSVLDFFIPSLNLGINVASLYWHYSRPSARLADELQREQLEAQGIQMIFIDEEDIYRNANYYVKEALELRDHSRTLR